MDGNSILGMEDPPMIRRSGVSKVVVVVVVVVADLADVSTRFDNKTKKKVMGSIR
jgi:hypothetical protein